jgi:hypothetical protein
MRLYFVHFLTLCALTSCTKDENGTACTEPLSIRSVTPPANPAGYELLIQGQGLDDAEVEVFFGDGIPAPSEWTEELQGLVTLVPQALPNFTELVVRRGDCLARTNFEVYGSFPADVPANLSQIVVPAPPASIPPSLQNAWPNAADLAHSVFLVPDSDNPGQWVPGQEPCPDACSTEFHNDASSPFNGNPISGTYDTTTLAVTLYIDRTAKGLGVDTLEGQFINPIASGVATGSELGILLFSRASRQQLLFLFPK